MDEARELAEHGGFLGSAGTADGFFKGQRGGILFVTEVATGDLEAGGSAGCAGLGIGEGEDEVVEGEGSGGAGEDGPLGVCGVESAEEGGLESVVEFEFAGEGEGDAGHGVCAEDAAADLFGEMFVCEVQGEADIVPAEVAEASERFGVGMGPDV